MVERSRGAAGYTTSEHRSNRRGCPSRRECSLGADNPDQANQAPSDGSPISTPSARLAVSGGSFSVAVCYQVGVPLKRDIDTDMVRPYLAVTDETKSKNHESADGVTLIALIRVATSTFT